MSEQPDQSEAKTSEKQAIATPAASGGIFARLTTMLRTGLRELEWSPVLLYGIAAGLLMSLSFLGPTLTIIAGIVPVGAGLLLGRRVKAYYGLHGFMTGLIGGLISTIALAVTIFLTPFGPTMQQMFDPTRTMTKIQIWMNLASFTALSLIAFCSFGTSMAGRTESRNRQMREQIDTRGGSLQRPGTIRGFDDIRGLSLPQFGTYIKNLFVKQGFQFKDYRFIDKDKHLDLWMDHEDEPWHLRLSVADKISPGTVESLLQEMRHESCRKGVVLTSTEFMPSTIKAAKGRPIVLIDGQTLYEIAEK